MSETAKLSFPETDSDWDSNEVKRFRTLALRYQEIGAAEGIRINPFRSPEMPYFTKATPEERKAATDFLETIVSIHEETIAASEKPINTKQLLWRALSRLSLVPSPDIFNHMTDEDVTIIYSDTQSAVFWNLQFFTVSSLTVEEMFFGQWFNFTKRDPAIEQKLYEMAVNVISGKITGTFKPDVPEHEVEEVGTIECTKTIMDVCHGSVLTKNGKFGGLLVIQRMKVIG